MSFSNINPLKSLELALVGVLLLSIILGAHVIELFGYPPCTLCLYQRWPYYIGLIIVLAISLSHGHERIPQLFTYTLLLTLIISFGLGLYHAGVEFTWWEGPSGCSGKLEAFDIHQMIEAIKGKAAVSCTTPNILIFGLSLSVWNAMLSLVMAFFVFKALRKNKN